MLHAPDGWSYATEIMHLPTAVGKRLFRNGTFNFLTGVTGLSEKRDHMGDVALQGE